MFECCVSTILVESLPLSAVEAVEASCQLKTQQLDFKHWSWSLRFIISYQWSNLHSPGFTTQVFSSYDPPPATTTPEEFIRMTKGITMATAKAVAAGNSCRQEDIIATANLSRRAIADMLHSCKVHRRLALEQWWEKLLTDVVSTWRNILNAWQQTECKDLEDYKSVWLKKYNYDFRLSAFTICFLYLIRSVSVLSASCLPPRG